MRKDWKIRINTKRFERWIQENLENVACGISKDQEWYSDGNLKADWIIIYLKDGEQMKGCNFGGAVEASFLTIYLSFPVKI